MKEGNKRIQIGNVFGELTVVKFIGKNKLYQNVYLCECSCGNKKEVLDQRLLTGNTKSCGCLKVKRLIKHGMSRTKIYQVWQQMIERCYTETCANYNKYGAIGTKVCDEWRGKENGFINFWNWAKDNGYSEGLTLDRINTYGDYEPNNCRWATYMEQNVNLRPQKNNKSGYTGCFYLKEIDKWRASISINNKTVHIGHYNNLKECVDARNQYIDDNHLPHQKNIWKEDD